jgi:hypothetical protein
VKVMPHSISRCYHLNDLSRIVVLRSSCIIDLNYNDPVLRFHRGSYVHSDAFYRLFYKTVKIILNSYSTSSVMSVFLGSFRILLSCAFDIGAVEEYKIMSLPQALLKFGFTPQ